MFAYVKYIEDGCKEIVPIFYIKDFDHNASDLTNGAFTLHGTVRFGTVRHGMAQFGSVCISTAV